MLLQKDKARTASKLVSKARAKQTGEVFTPRELIDEMLDKLPSDVWNAGETFLEPAAGDGNFVIAVLERKIAAGCTPTQAISDVYAIEYMLDNVQAMKKRVLDLIGDTPDHRAIVDEHIAHANTLDPYDTSEGRRYPKWMDDCPSKQNRKQQRSFKQKTIHKPLTANNTRYFEMATKKTDDFATMSVADKLALIAQLQEQIKAEAAAERAKFVDKLQAVQEENEKALAKVQEENQKRLDDLKAEAEAAGITDLFADEQQHENGKWYLVNPANPSERWGRSGRKPPWLIDLIAAGAAEEPPKTEKEVKDGLKKEWVPF